MANSELDVRRIVKAIAASWITGLAIYFAVVRGALPALERRLSSGQVDWLAASFEQHPGIVLTAVTLVAGVLALPVLVVFRWVYGPLTDSSALDTRKRL